MGEISANSFWSHYMSESGMQPKVGGKGKVKSTLKREGKRMQLCPSSGVTLISDEALLCTLGQAGQLVAEAVGLEGAVGSLDGK